MLRNLTHVPQHNTLRKGSWVMALTAVFLLQEEEHVEQQDQYQVEHPPPGHGHHLHDELEDCEAGAGTTGLKS